MKNPNRYFIVSIEVKANEWHWKAGDIVRVPVYTNSKYNAQKRFENQNYGSEYPEYEIVEIYDPKEDGASFFYRDQLTKLANPKNK